MKKFTFLLLSVLIYCDVISKPKDDNSTLSLGLALLSQSGTASAPSANITDESLYEESIATSSLSFFPNTPSSPFNSRISDRAHGDLILMRVNSTAKNSIDATNKVPIGGAFAEGSLIVKERYSSGSIIQIIAMKKNSKFTSGWAWGEYTSSGAV